MTREAKTEVIKYKPEIILKQHELPIFRRYKDGITHVIIGAENMYQACRCCGHLKNEKEYNLHGYIDQYGRRMLRTDCRECQNANDRLLHNLKKENGPPPSHCQLCGEESNKLNLDHCHITGKFRGWLCYSCNVGLGKLRDSVEMLERGIKYLKGELNE